MTRCVIQLRVDEIEKAAWTSMAAKAGLSLSAWLRGKANATAPKPAAQAL